MTGWRMLLRKEVLRFVRVLGQTLGGPILTAWLYLVIFGHALSSQTSAFAGVGYTAFLVPGLAMMSLLQNAFANSSSSLVASKVTGNLVFVLLTPLAAWEWWLAYVGAALLRGLLVAAGVWAVALPFAWVGLAQPLWALAFAVLGGVLMGALGIVAGLWSEKFEQMAAFQNFLVMPLTFLAGVFYSVRALPEPWQALTQFNPFFYLIDGFRYGFFGHSDAPVGLSLAIVSLACLGVGVWAWALLRVGYKIRH